ncbi:unnamed protein product, partial [Ixodes pacificus]
CPGHDDAVQVKPGVHAHAGLEGPEPVGQHGCAAVAWEPIAVDPNGNPRSPRRRLFRTACPPAGPFRTRFRNARRRCPDAQENARLFPSRRRGRPSFWPYLFWAEGLRARREGPEPVPAARTPRSLDPVLRRSAASPLGGARSASAIIGATCGAQRTAKVSVPSGSFASVGVSDCCHCSFLIPPGFQRSASAWRTSSRQRGRPEKDTLTGPSGSGISSGSRGETAQDTLRDGRRLSHQKNQRAEFSS